MPETNGNKRIKDIPPHMHTQTQTQREKAAKRLSSLPKGKTKILERHEFQCLVITARGPRSC